MRGPLAKPPCPSHVRIEDDIGMARAGLRVQVLDDVDHLRGMTVATCEDWHGQNLTRTRAAGGSHVTARGGTLRYPGEDMHTDLCTI